MMALKAEGVSKVYVVDIMQKRLDKALELGATGVINSKEEDVLETMAKLTNGKGIDLVIETAGMEITTRQAIHVTKKGATIVLVGYSKSGEMTLPLSLALDKELTFKTVFRYRHIYPMAIEAVASGKVNLKGIVTNVFDFGDIQLWYCEPKTIIKRLLFKEFAERCHIYKIQFSGYLPDTYLMIIQHVQSMINDFFAYHFVGCLFKRFFRQSSQVLG